MDEQNYLQLVPQIEEHKEKHQQACDDVFHRNWHYNRAGFYANLECVISSVVLNVLYHTGNDLKFDTKQWLREYIQTVVDTTISKSDTLLYKLEQELEKAEAQAEADMEELIVDMDELIADVKKVKGIDLGNGVTVIDLSGVFDELNKS